MLKKFKKKNVNLLKCVAVKSSKIKTHNHDDGTVDIIVPRDGVIESLVRKLAKTPKQKIISFDPLGSCVWKAIDNERNLGDIAKIVESEFGDDANPLYERLLSFIRILKNNEFIKLMKVD